MQCTRSQIRAGLLACLLLASDPGLSFGQANPAPVGGPDEVLPLGSDASPNSNEAGTGRRNSCAGIDCLRFGEKEELYAVLDPGQTGLPVDDKALCTAIGN